MNRPARDAHEQLAGEFLAFNSVLLVRRQPRFRGRSRSCQTASPRPSASTTTLAAGSSSFSLRRWAATGSIVSPKRWIAVIVAAAIVRSRQRDDGPARAAHARCMRGSSSGLLEHRLDVRQAEQATDARPELGHVLLAERSGSISRRSRSRNSAPMIGTWSRGPSGRPRLGRLADHLVERPTGSPGCSG